MKLLRSLNSNLNLCDFCKGLKFGWNGFGVFFLGIFLILWLLKVFDGGLLMNRNNWLVYLSGLFDFSVKLWSCSIRLRLDGVWRKSRTVGLLITVLGEKLDLNCSMLHDKRSCDWSGLVQFGWLWRTLLFGGC